MGEEDATLAFDSTVQAEPTTVVPSESVATMPLAPSPVLVRPPGLPTPKLVKPPGLSTPKGDNSAGFCPMSLNLQPHENQEAADLRCTSLGKPVKVWLPQTYQPPKQLKPTIPAKKRPPYPELIKAARPTLDPMQPVKKRVPVFSEGFLEGAFTKPKQCISAMPAVVPGVSTAPVPR